MVGVGDAFADGDHAASVLGVNLLDVLDEFLLVEGDFGQINKVRSGIGALAAEGGGGGQEAGMAAHDDVDLDPLERAVVEVIANEGLGDELGRRAEAGAMIGAEEVVIDGLGDMEDEKVVILGHGDLVDNVGGLGRVVAANVEEVAHVVRLQDVEHFLALGLGGLFANRAQRGGGGPGDLEQIAPGLGGQVDQILAQDALDAGGGRRRCAR